MKRAITLVLPAAIGVAAGLRSMTAPALLVWAARRRMIRVAGSSLASMAVGTMSGKITKLAVTELLVDKLPFAPDRTDPGPLAWRALSGAACGATVATAVRRPAWEGAVAGGTGALFGAVAGAHVRKRASQKLPNLAAGLLEDALAIAIAAGVIWQVSRAKSNP